MNVEFWARLWHNRDRLRWILMFSDAVLIVIALFLAWFMRYELEIGGTVEIVNYRSFSSYLPVAALTILLMWLNLGLESAYRRQRGATWSDEISTIVNATARSLLVVVFFFFFYRTYVYSRLIFAYYTFFIIFLLSVARLALRQLIARLHRHGIGVLRILIVGAGEGARKLMRHIVAQPELGYEVVGFVANDPEGQSNIGRFTALGPIAGLPTLIDDHNVDRVLITLPWSQQYQISRILDTCTKRGIPVRIVPDLFQLSLTGVTMDEIRGVPLMGMREPVITGGDFALKRLLDIGVSGGALLIGAPLWGLIALAIKLDSEGPVVYDQTRVGRGGKPFTIHKFRSMRKGADDELSELSDHNEASGPLFKMKEDPRVTRVGRILRKFSLDEVPQLWNVLRGDMSLIGPRPALPAEVDEYEEWHLKRLDVTPGLTGLWQVSGRSDVTFDEMVLLDIYYAEQWSPLLDTMIFLKTIPTVLFQRGAY